MARVKIEIWVDLDPMAGTFHTKESAEIVIEHHLKQIIPHYNPSVTEVVAKGGMLKLEKLPKPDGAPYKCSVDRRIEEWPYVGRCKNDAVGLLSTGDYLVLQHSGYTGMRLVCQDCFNVIQNRLGVIAARLEAESVTPCRRPWES